MSTHSYDSYKPEYHNVSDAAYVLPNDADEHVRLSEQGRLFSAVMNNHVIHAPLDTNRSDQTFFDVGCGTGIVADELGETFPNAEVYGLDLTPAPAKPSELGPRPPNVYFLQGNILTQMPALWVAPDGTRPFDQDKKQFDLVFSRLLACGMTDWPAYVGISHSLLKPGGYLEIHDVDFAWYDKVGVNVSDNWPWWLKYRKAAEIKGLHLSCGSTVKQWMEEAGFIDIVVVEYRFCWGGKWATTPELRAFGDYLALVMPSTYWHLISKMMEGSGVSSEEIGDMQQAMVKDFGVEEEKYWHFYVTTGRKGQ